ncbi:MAG TPA: sigma-70 family RNA polymerase sigma factor [Planctomycetota bacterium]|jgi:RNA polymerase sigma-70 factor (ECF subfamily)|nr:sigma-70 family RNA polymerase sigma factor [Planctomycetota bacterium]
MEGDGAKLSDAELVAAFQKGKLAAFQALVDRHQRSLINFFYHLTWDRQAAEDCAQEVFLRLYAHLDRYEPQAKFTTFLFRVARNLWIDRMRSEAAHGGRPVSLEAVTARDGEGASLAARLPAEGPTPVDVLSRREAQEALRRALDRLPEEQKAVVILSELQGMKYQEIAQILDIPVGTVKSRMHAAMERLKTLLADEAEKPA